MLFRSPEGEEEVVMTGTTRMTEEDPREEQETMIGSVTMMTERMCVRV